MDLEADVAAQGQFDILLHKLNWFYFNAAFDENVTEQMDNALKRLLRNEKGDLLCQRYVDHTSACHKIFFDKAVENGFAAPTIISMLIATGDSGAILGKMQLLFGDIEGTSSWRTSCTASRSWPRSTTSCARCSRPW